MIIHDFPLPFQRAVETVRAAEDACNLRDLDTAVMSNSIDCQWRNREEFLWGREQVRGFLRRRWQREGERRLIAELWAMDRKRLAIRFSSEFRDENGMWFRSYGNENWELNDFGLVRWRLTSVNEIPIREYERVLLWPPGVRPAGFTTHKEMGL